MFAGQRDTQLYRLWARDICRTLLIVLIGGRITSPASECMPPVPSSCTITQEHGEHREHMEHMEHMEHSEHRWFEASPHGKGKVPQNPCGFAQFISMYIMELQ